MGGPPPLPQWTDKEIRQAINRYTYLAYRDNTRTDDQKESAQQKLFQLQNEARRRGMPLS